MTAVRPYLKQNNTHNHNHNPNCTCTNRQPRQSSSLRDTIHTAPSHPHTLRRMPDSATVATALLLAAASALLIAAMLYPSALLRWFQRKRYQYEVTFSLYMLTSTEKFIFSTPAPCSAHAPPTLPPAPRRQHHSCAARNCHWRSNADTFVDSVLFLLLSLLIIAASLYLPEHLSIITSRIFYYYSGNENAHSGLAQKALGEPAHIHGAGLAGNGRGFMEP